MRKLIATTTAAVALLRVDAVDKAGNRHSKLVTYTVAAPPACSNGYVALTYDDGPTALTRQYVDRLVANNAKATFFLVGDNEQSRPLMHDGYANTLSAMRPILEGLKLRGLCPGKIVPSGEKPILNSWGWPMYVNVVAFA